MTDFPNTSEGRQALLKHMILQLHKGEAPQEIRKRLFELLKNIPYNEVVQVEQELINEGLPEEEVLKFCDIHTAVLEGNIDTSKAKKIPVGHPVDVFIKENKELLKNTSTLSRFYKKIKIPDGIDDLKTYIIQLKSLFNNLMDVEKHYMRIENLLFPYLEKYNITGPPKVLWGKHDETRGFLKAVQKSLSEKNISFEELDLIIELVLKPASKAIEDMTMKEEQILFPMCMDKLKNQEWYEISQQSIDIGYCLYDPDVEWKPDGVEAIAINQANNGKIRLSSGKLDVDELEAIFKTMPFEVTFVDKNDKVKYFSYGKHQIFQRNRAVLGRDVRLCHPPKSVNIVEQIISDFKSGKQDKASFWLQINGMFVFIEYYALRDANNSYIGTMEIVQDISKQRNLKGEQRLLNYGESNEG